MLQHKISHKPDLNLPGEWQDLDSEAAFKRIYAAYWKKLFVIAYHRLKDKQEAEDVIHDVFVSLWMNRGRVTIRTLENYLSVAVKNQVFTKLRKRSRVQVYAETQATEAFSEQLVINSIENKQLIGELRNEIESLPDKCRLIFKYSRDEGMQVKQIAEQLHISPKTVQNHLNKALRHLRIAMRTFLNEF